ncbi:MAG: carboxypeptidase-like regulatory domain-containing protein [Thaumarchaeota archaeon]|nr:carboxypeptidase-like regulatory domain-containing protein [Nitrososphaerota archaeon]
MNSRAFLVFLLIASQGVMVGQILPSRAAPSPIQLGYGPSALFPISSGVPVYTSGDQLWARSIYNETVKMAVGPENIFGNSTVVVSSQQLYPGIPALVHIFTGSDPQGFWYANLENISFGRFDFLLTDSAHNSANLTMTGQSLVGGALALNYSVDPGLQFYDAEACSLGSQNQATAYLQVPSGLGGGQISADWNGSAVRIEGIGLNNRSLTVSLALYHSYSFLVPGSSSTLISRSIAVAESDGAIISDRNASAMAPIRSDVWLRDGRYLLRAIFHGAEGASLAETNVLLTGDPHWVWLDQCASSPVYTNTFTDTVPLGSDSSKWPRLVYLLYRVGGVEGYAASEVRLNISGVDFKGAPWGAKLSGYAVSVTAISGDSAYSISNQSIFLLQSAPYARLSYSVALGNQTFFRGEITPLVPFTFGHVSLNVSELIVRYQDNGVAIEGADVMVADAIGNLTRTATGRDGTATLYLPPGSYTVEAAAGNSTSRQTVSMAAGQSYELTFGNAGADAQTTEAIIGLSLVAGIGILLNVLVVARKRRKRLGTVADNATSQLAQSFPPEGPSHPSQ